MPYAVPQHTSRYLRNSSGISLSLDSSRGKLEPVGYSGAAMTAAVLSAWQRPQSFVPMLQGKGALSSWTPAT